MRIQTIQNDLVKADAAAANAYLRGGSEDPATRAAYDAAISDAARRLAQPAATAADSTILETAVDGLSRYTGLVEQARANNRQGMQVGAAYQRQAGDVLRNEIVPALERVSRSDQERVAASYDRANQYTTLLVVAGAIAVLVLLLVQLWLAMRTHRFLNVPLAGATVAVLAALMFGSSVLGNAADQADAVATVPYAATVALSGARTAAFDAKAREAFGLINRGNAAADEAKAQGQIEQAVIEMSTAQARGAATASSGRLRRLADRAQQGADSMTTPATGSPRATWRWERPTRCSRPSTRRPSRSCRPRRRRSTTVCPDRGCP